MVVQCVIMARLPGIRSSPCRSSAHQQVYTWHNSRPLAACRAISNGSTPLQAASSVLEFHNPLCLDLPQSAWRPTPCHTRALIRHPRATSQSDSSPPRSIPVTLLSGTSSAAKHHLISSILASTPSIAVLMSSTQSSEALLSLIQPLLPASHELGSADCTTLGDGSLLGTTEALEQVLEAASKGQVHHLLIEDGPFDSPLMTSAAYSDLYPDLSAISHMYTLITVVDAARFMPDVMSSQSIVDLTSDELLEVGRSLDEEEEGDEEVVEEEEVGDDRMLSDVLVEQVEYAHHLVLYGVSSMPEQDKRQLQGVLSHLNRTAQVHGMDARSSCQEAAQWLGTGGFDLYQIQQQGPGWAVELNALDEQSVGQLDPTQPGQQQQQQQSIAGTPSPPPADTHRQSDSSVFRQLPVRPSDGSETGVTSWLYLSHRPFHPERLLSHALAGQWPGVVRSKGYCWLATRHDYMGLWQSAGGSWQCEPNGKWQACVSDAPAGRSSTGPTWHPVWGDRCQQIVWTGVNMQTHDLHTMLDACLLTDDELAQGPEAWAAYEDPLPEWLFEEHDSDDDHDH